MAEEKTIANAKGLMEKIYIEDVSKLEEEVNKVPSTHLMALGKVLMLINLNMRYELIMVDHDLDVHPYELVKKLIWDAQKFWQTWKSMAFIEDDAKGVLSLREAKMEEKHLNLFQSLWVNFNKKDYDKRIERYEYRLDINGLGDGFLNGMRCIDFGCGHGNFSHALLKKGASYVYGLDYGERCIEYANKARDVLGIAIDKLTFEVGSVYEVGQPDNSYDFAIQNGVFHHLDNEDAAYKEVWRVLKPGGWFWIYTTGDNSIACDLWRTSTNILNSVPHSFVVSVLDQLNLKVGKRYHLGDGLNATYRRTNWKDFTARLKGYGFGNFRRITGGYSTDFDHDVIAADKYGVEKFGAGDLRLLAQKL